MFSAISSADMFSSHFDHVDLSQISNLVPTPIITVSFLSLQLFLGYLVLEIFLVCLIHIQLLLIRKNLTKFLAFLSESGNAFNFVSKFSHSFCENANKHPSNPFVTMNFSPMSCLNFAGIINLPFVSRECSYSPISN